MKIVKFADGTYAVRRWIPFCYEYLDNARIRGWENKWWPFFCRDQATVATYEDASRLIYKYQIRKRKNKDKGTPVKV